MVSTVVNRRGIEKESGRTEKKSDDARRAAEQELERINAVKRNVEETKRKEAEAKKKVEEETKKKAAEVELKKLREVQQALKEGKKPWMCGKCTFKNGPLDRRCQICSSNGPVSNTSGPVHGLGSSLAWSCSACTMENEPSASTCSVCGTANPRPMNAMA